MPAAKQSRFGPFGYSLPQNATRKPVGFPRGEGVYRPAIDYDRVVTQRNTGYSTQDVLLPRGIVRDDILMIWMETFQNPTAPTGWTVFHAATNIGSRIVTGMWKRCDGTEGRTESFTLAGSSYVYAMVWLIKNASLRSPFFSAGSGSADPPSLTPGGGAQRFLWFAIATRVGGLTLPAGYENQISANVSMGGSRVLIAASENPAAMGGASGDRRAVTAAFLPRRISY